MTRREKTFEEAVTELHPTAQEIARLGHQLGWRWAVNSRGLLYLTSVVSPNQVIELPPVRQWNQHKARTTREKIVRYGDPAKVAIYQQRRVEADAEARHLKQPASPTIPEPEVTPEPESFVSQTKTLVSERPWQAKVGGITKRGTVLVYDSQAVIERLWSDGLVDFRCAAPGCARVDRNPRSITAHYSNAVFSGKSDVPHPKVLSYSELTKYEISLRDYRRSTAVVHRFRNGKRRGKDESEKPVGPSSEPTPPPEPEVIEQVAVVNPEELTDARDRLRRIREIVLEDLVEEESHLVEKIEAVRAEMQIEIDQLTARLAKVTQQRDQFRDAIKTFNQLQSLGVDDD